LTHKYFETHLYRAVILIRICKNRNRIKKDSHLILKIIDIDTNNKLS